MAKNITVNPINPITLEFQDYNSQDDILISNFNVETTFDSLVNYIAYFVYDLNNNLVYSEESDFSGYRIVDNNVVLYPETDLIDSGFDVGQYNTFYNFLNNELSSSPFQRYYIDEISPDRTEIRLNTTQISNLEVVASSQELLSKIQTSTNTYFDFYLNFGENRLIIANNLLLDNSNTNDPTVLIKLYEPLPLEFNLKAECWVVTEVADSLAYNIDIVETFDNIDQNIYLKGPNLNLALNDQTNNSTDYANYSTLTTSSYTTGSGSLQYQLNSLLAERGIEINIDYSNYSDFIYFSSALTRLENFYYKLQLIEEYQYSSSLATGAGSNSYVVGNNTIWQSKIDEIITTFDGYDYFLYYESGSKAWPKSNSTYPYTNVGTLSATGLAFLATQSISASEYDAENNNILVEAIPSYLREDSNNDKYELFVEMLGEMFDNIWIYYKDVTNKYNADNRLDYGVSKDLVADILRDLGLKIYQNSFGSSNIYTALLGITPSGSLFPFPDMTGSLPTPSGFEYVNTQISASNDYVSLEDVEKSIYKRLYHNLPLILKKKGTTVGLQNLITIFGVPDTILKISEFGGKDRNESNDWDYWKQQYNYVFDTSGSYYVSSSFQLNSAWAAPSNRPATVEFRFQTRGLPFNTASIAAQSLWSTNSGSALILTYTGSGFISSSYSGSIVDSYYQYAKLDFIPDSTSLTTSASVYLPFYDGKWWSVMIISGSGTFDLYAANNLYNGNDGSTVGYIASSSIADASGYWSNSTVSYFGSSSLGTLFSGSLQEARYYTVAIDVNSFRDYTMNPYSIESNSTNSAPNQLAFRASLGGELYTSSVSIHPKVTGSWISTSSFVSDSNFWVSSSNYIPNVETFFLAQPAAGIQNIVSNKIQIVNSILPVGDTLSQYRSIQQTNPLSSSYTENLAYTEVAFSPQNEINDDIMGQLGFFNLGEYIGDPRLVSSSATSYPALDLLRNAYFEKYKSNYDINDYVRLIKFIDNALFKTIQDFIPARSSLASGVVIKQHLLERNKYPVPQVDISSSIAYGAMNNPLTFQDITITASIGSKKGLSGGQTVYTASSDYESIPLETISGSQGGAYANLSASYGLRPVTSSTGQRFTAEYGLPINEYVGLNFTQSWLGFNVTPFGLTAFTQSNAQEFFNGELSGSNLVVENGDLNGLNPFLNVNTSAPIYDTSGSLGTTGVRRSAATLGLTTAKNTVIDDLLILTPPPGDFSVAYVFYPSGSRTGTYTATIIGQSPSSGVYPASGYGEELYLNTKTAVGSGGDFIDGTLLVPSGYNLVSASFNGANPGDRPFFYNDGATMTAVPEVYGNNLYGITTTYGSIDNILNANSKTADDPGISGSLEALAFSGYRTGYQFFTNDTVTLYFETPLQYYFVGLIVNNTDDTGVNYANLWQQCNSILFNLTDKSGGIVSVGSYAGGQPVPITVAPLSTTLTALYVNGNPVPIVGLGTGDSVPFLSSVNQNISLITSPGVNIDFTYNENNALIDNAVTTAGAPGFYDLDYTQGITTPVNYLNVISASIYGSGSSTLAPVQKFNWSSNRSILPRYSGSKMIGAVYNFYTPASGSWPGDQSFGKDPVIDYYGNVSFNVDYVQGTYPEMQNGTALNVKNLNIYTSAQSSNVFDQNSPDVFNFVIDQYLGFSQSAEIFSNDVSPIKDNLIRTVDGTIGWPANSTYFIPRQQTFGNNYGGVFWTASLDSIIFCSKDYTLFPQIVDDNNRYATGSIPGGKNTILYSVQSASFAVSKSIAGGEDWYMTFYSGALYPLPTFDEAYTSGGLDSYNSGSVYNYGTEFSLQSQGVYKITSFQTLGFSPAGIATDGNPYKITLNRPLPDNVKGIGSGSKSNNNTGLSALIWKSNPFPQPVILENRPDYFPSGLGDKGGYVIPDDFNSSLKASVFALQTQGIIPQITTAGNVVATIPLIAELSQGTTQTGAAPSGTGGSVISCPFGTSAEPFGVVGAFVGERRIFTRPDGADVDYVWDGCFWGQG